MPRLWPYRSVIFSAALDAVLLSVCASLVLHWPHFQDSSEPALWLMQRVLHDVLVAFTFAFILDLSAIWLARRVCNPKTAPMFAFAAAPLFAGALFALPISVLPVFNGDGVPSADRHILSIFGIVFLSVFLLELLVHLLAAKIFPAGRDQA